MQIFCKIYSEKIRKYKGFYIQKRNLREYNTNIGANVLGYVAEVNRKNIVNVLVNDQGKVLFDDKPTAIKDIKRKAINKINGKLVL